MTHVGKQKLTASLILFCAIAVLAVASQLDPDPSGLGTHQQIHLPKIAGVEVHLPACSMKSLTGVPCATCGMTTSFAHAVRGHWYQAFRVQPFGFILFLLTVGLIINQIAYVTVNRSLHRVPLPWKKVALALLVFWMLAWLYKIWTTLHPSPAGTSGP